MPWQHPSSSHPSDFADLLQPEIERLPRREATARLLGLAAASDDEAERHAYQDRVVELNMQVAVDVARRYRSRGVSSTTSSRSPTSAWSRPCAASTPSGRPTS